MLLGGLPFGLAYGCGSLFLLSNRDADTASIGTILLTLMLLTFGVGLVAYRHSTSALRGKPSSPLRLPPAIALAGVFGLCVVAGLAVTSARVAPGVFFPPLLLVAATLPPLGAVAWFMGRSADGVTWRRGSLAFVGGATVSVMLAIVLELVLPIIVLAVFLNLFNIVTRGLQTLLDALAGANVAAALTSRGFIILLVQLAVIAPLVEELCKPLVTLPLVRHLARRDAFLVGALAGAGFAALENMIYTGFGSSVWAGVLIVRALGGAIHPFGAGLVAVAWRAVLRREPDAWLKWLGRYGAAVGMHALWNGGSLLVITLAGAQLFGRVPRVDVLGVSATGLALALLVLLGVAALWLGRIVSAEKSLPTLDREAIAFNPSDRAVAVWALACLVAIVPLGIAGLRLLIR